MMSPDEAAPTAPEPGVFDLELLGLQHELRAWLGDRGLIWFEDFSTVEVDLSNRELRVSLLCPVTRASRALLDFSKRYGFRRLTYSESRHSITLHRV